MSNLITIGVLQRPIELSPEHQHPFWEIVVYTHGHGRTIVGDVEIPLAPGVVVCMPPRQMQREEAPLGFRNIHILVHQIPRLSGDPLWFHDDEESSVHAVASQLNREFHQRKDNWQRVTEYLLEILITLIHRQLEPNPYPEPVRQLERLLIENVSNPDFRLGDALRRVPLSPNHLRGLFQQATGETPLAYLTRRRIEEAQRLLETGGYAVKEVAWRVGVPDPYYFSRLFRKITGAPPSGMARGKRR